LIDKEKAIISDGLSIRAPLNGEICNFYSLIELLIYQKNNFNPDFAVGIVMKGKKAIKTSV
jgi:hypothetical protein